ncbi:MAG: hypothetical protein P8L37_01550 [Phycisphaerales bacterium]|nr:hypothetical protein [Phycisphaerales bacterium]
MTCYSPRTFGLALGLILSIPACISLSQAAPTGALGAASQAELDLHTLDWPVGELQQHRVSSGPLHNATGSSRVVFDHDVVVPGAAWIRIYFDDVALEGASSVRMTSLEDGEVQELDAAGLLMWRNSSAYFNGDAVQIQLIAAPATFDNEMTIGALAVEMVAAGHSRGGCGICGNDDRVPSSVDWAARMMPVGCTGTIYNTANCFVTAGHCLNGADTLQFNVPASSSNCSTNNPPIADQFPVIDLDGFDGGVGADYGAMKAGTNNLGQTPYERYGVYMPLASSVPSSGTASVNGFGVDEECARSQTQQFHDGPISGTDSTSIFYDIDITFGNSGSSIIRNGEIIGVVTHCSGSCLNYGTRIDLPAFENVRSQICSIPAGACCVGTSCVVLEQDNCEDGGGTFIGEDTNCSGDPCTPTGACCTGTSCSVGTESDCNGTYLGDGTDCSNDPCAAPTGACCVSGNCTIQSEADCGGTYFGDGSNCAGDPCGGGSGDDAFAGLSYSIVGSNLVDDAQPTWTVDVFVHLAADCRLDAVAGDANQDKMVSTTGSFYQNTFGGATSQAINPALFSAFPDLRYDSFVTIGRTDQTDNAMSDIGIDFSAFEAGGAIDSSDGSWYVTPEDSQGDSEAYSDQLCEDVNGVRIARLTVRGANASVYFEALFQGKDETGTTWQASGSLSIINDDCNVQCTGDYDGNGTTDVSDLLAVIASWGIYDVTDLLTVIADWGCGAP